VDAATLLLAAVRRAGAPRVAVAARRAGIMAGMAVLAGVLLLAALGCALAALWIDVAPQLGQAGAALAVAGCLLVLGLAALAVMRRRPTRMPASAPAPIPLDALMRDNKAALLTAALVAGLYAGLNGRPR
jgi:hypothetical protein